MYSQMSARQSAKNADAAFLLTEIKLANTLLETARISGDPDHVRECIALARQAQNTARHLLSTLDFPPKERDSLVARLTPLTARLAEHLSEDES
jgi:signal transduction histidine kinase